GVCRPPLSAPSVSLPTVRVARTVRPVKVTVLVSVNPTGMILVNFSRNETEAGAVAGPGSYPQRRTPYRCTPRLRAYHSGCGRTRIRSNLVNRSPRWWPSRLDDGACQSRTE